MSEDSEVKTKIRAEVYVKFPLYRIIIYEFTTVFHYLLGGFGLIIGYLFLSWGFLIGSIYLVFAFLQMYVLMPLTVCPNCVYYRMDNGCCVSGLNKISRKMLGLTQREIEICNMIKSGLTSKEIARVLNVSYRTVETHRNNIRNKLEITKKGINLITYLKSL